MAFKQTIMSHHAQGWKIYFIDETSINSWVHSQKIWQHPKDPFKQILSQPRLSATIIGALRSDGQFGYTLADTTNLVCFQTFLDFLIPSMNEAATSILVLDNHPAHKSITVKQRLSAAGVTVIYLPVCASYLNPIEVLWAVLKRAF
jgi:hypothetical protein